MKHSSSISSGIKETSYLSNLLADIRSFFVISYLKTYLFFKTKGKNVINSLFFKKRVWLTIEEMPIYHWIKILETADLKWIFKDSKGNETKRISEHWLTLQQQYIDEFDLDEGYKQQLKQMRNLAILNCDFSITKDRSLLNDIKMLEIDLQATNKKTFKFYEILDHVEKHKGYAIDPHKTSVMKWYYSLKNMSNGKAN